ncbi:MAG: rRNA maturation RNase YbeY [Planctomycetes bacterium]|nr:rRNA maturation RNase YbeY [Planctomycetota bacterium]
MNSTRGPRGARRAGKRGEKRARPAAVRITRLKRGAASSDRAVRRIVRAALAFGGRPEASIGVVLMGDAALAELHARFLGDPSPTDVIAFELGEDGGLDGEICCSVDCARRVARERGVPFERELALYLVHGALHLCGFEDDVPRARRRMRAAERAVLEVLGYPEDPLPHP